MLMCVTTIGDSGLFCKGNIPGGVRCVVTGDVSCLDGASAVLVRMREGSGHCVICAVAVHVALRCSLRASSLSFSCSAHRAASAVVLAYTIGNLLQSWPGCAVVGRSALSKSIPFRVNIERICRSAGSTSFRLVFWDHHQRPIPLWA